MRWPLVPDNTFIVPKPPLYRPMLFPEGNVVGALAKFPAVDGLFSRVLLRMLLNSIPETRITLARTNFLRNRCT